MADRVPGRVRYNTADGTVDAIGQKNVTDGTVNFTLCEADGTAYSDYTVSETEPEDTTKYWLCTGSDPHCLKSTALPQSCGTRYRPPM